MMKKYNLAVILILLAGVVIQFLFVEYYWNDKTTTSSRIVQNMSEHQSLVAKDFACFNHDQSHSQYHSWGEEPPLFHLVGIIFYYIFGDLSLKVVPMLFMLLTIWGLFLIIRTYPLSNSSHPLRYWVLIPLFFTPSFYIHMIRYLPDNMALTFLVFGLYYFIQEKWWPSWGLLLIAVTTKVLVIVPLAFLCFFHLIHHFRRGKKLFFILIAFSLTIVPTLIWFFYLYKEQISNPFFEINRFIPQHTGGSDFSILGTKKYWSKIFQWYFYRGTGIIWLILFITFFFKKLKLEIREHYVIRVIACTALTFIINVILFRGPQITAPWYSFYYQIFFIVVGGAVFLQLKKKGIYIISFLSLFQTIFFLHYGFFRMPQFSDASVQLPCHFHQYQRMMHIKETQNSVKSNNAKEI